MPLSLPQMALIDLDGTLVDTAPDIALAADEMLESLGMAPAGEAKAREWIGNGVERLVRRALTGTMDGEPEDALFNKAYPRFVGYYDACNGERSRPYPGVLEGIAFLTDAGVRLGCVTNKAARFTEPLLERLGLRDNFELVISGDTLPKKKPDPLPLTHAASYFGVTPGESLLVGDSISDVAAARAAGFAIACVSYGYNHGLDIRDAHPDVVIDSLAELPGVFAEAAPSG